MLEKRGRARSHRNRAFQRGPELIPAFAMLFGLPALQLKSFFVLLTLPNTLAQGHIEQSCQPALGLIEFSPKPNHSIQMELVLDRMASLHVLQQRAQQLLRHLDGLENGPASRP
jgi:hypothetical protein